MTKTIIAIPAAVLLAMSLAACGDNDDNQYSPSNSQAAPATSAAGGGFADTETANTATNANAGSAQAGPGAVAHLQGTQGNEDVSATIRFTPRRNGVAYNSRAQGLSPGKHGYHLHVNGDCSAPDASSAGTHFNLRGNSQNPPKGIDRITGNLGNLKANDDGQARDHGILAGASLSGPKGLIGRSVIIHAKPNDPSQPPMGAAGARQACGVIEAAGARS